MRLPGYLLPIVLLMADGETAGAPRPEHPSMTQAEIDAVRARHTTKKTETAGAPGSASPLPDIATVFEAAIPEATPPQRLQICYQLIETMPEKIRFEGRRGADACNRYADYLQAEIERKIADLDRQARAAQAR